MRVVCVGLSPTKLGRAAVCVSAAVTVMLLAGCASETRPNHVAGPMAQHPIVQKVEIEDDGVPVQSPPVRRMRPDEDDPTQPWSPNYGSGSTTSQTPALPAPRAARQVDAATAYPTRPMLGHDDGSGTAPPSVGTLTRLTAAESDAIIAEAISVQEMRRQ